MTEQDTALLAELDWCIEDGMSGPRTHACLIAARTALQSAAQATNDLTCRHALQCLYQAIEQYFGPSKHGGETWPTYFDTWMRQANSALHLAQEGAAQDRKEIEVLRYERDSARSFYERTVKILTGIHNLMYPPKMVIDGKVCFFNAPNVHEYMQGLSDRIRAIPDELAAIDAAMQTKEHG